MGLLTQLARALGLSKRPANIIVIGLDNSGKTTLINHLRPRKVRAVRAVRVCAVCARVCCPLMRATAALTASLRLWQGAAFEVTPTVGFNVEGFTKGRLRITCFDMSGQVRARCARMLHTQRPMQRAPACRSSTGACGSSTIATLRWVGGGTLRELRLTAIATQAVIFVIDSTDKLRMCVAKDELHSLLRHADIRGRRAPVLFFANKARCCTAGRSCCVMARVQTHACCFACAPARVRRWIWRRRPARWM